MFARLQRGRRASMEMSGVCEIQMGGEDLVSWDNYCFVLSLRAMRRVKKKELPPIFRDDVCMYVWYGCLFRMYAWVFVCSDGLRNHPEIPISFYLLFCSFEQEGGWHLFIYIYISMSILSIFVYIFLIFYLLRCPSF